MAALSLQEAADQAGTSKVDIWRAIQAGSLPAHKNGDGGFAIDPAELFRVFERPAPIPPEPQAVDPPESVGRPEAAASPASETPATDDISAAFATLAAELKGLLGAAPRGE